MNQNLKNKIDATDISISSILKDQKFYIDYFQREYRWQEKHIKLLVEDLTSTFLKSYKPTDKRPAVANYQSYYLGPVVFSVNTDDGKKSIIDGQQRITSITLLLIYLNHLQSESNDKVAISDLIFSESYGEKSFNMTDEVREPCLKALFETGSYSVQEDDDETVKNMVERYEDIAQTFPEELSNGALPYFIDWFIRNVVIVEITAYSDENAYTIFETMNDRGLNLTPTEMLKGYLLSRFKDDALRKSTNDFWKKSITRLQELDKEEDQRFIQAFLRAKYAVTIRQGQAGSKNEDFEKIGTRFHNWFRDNLKLVGLDKDSQEDFNQFVNQHFKYYLDAYLRIAKAKESLVPGLESVHYIQ